MNRLTCKEGCTCDKGFIRPFLCKINKWATIDYDKKTNIYKQVIEYEKKGQIIKEMFDQQWFYTPEKAKISYLKDAEGMIFFCYLMEDKQYHYCTKCAIFWNSKNTKDIIRFFNDLGCPTCKKD